MNDAKDPDKRGMGATLTAVYVQGDTAYIAEIGDSRAYLVRGDRIRQMTKDQSFVQLLLDSGAITKEEAKNVSAQEHHPSGHRAAEEAQASPSASWPCGAAIGSSSAPTASPTR